MCTYLLEYSLIWFSIRVTDGSYAILWDPIDYDLLGITCYMSFNNLMLIACSGRRAVQKGFYMFSSFFDQNY